jgi:hypothetical protein
MNKPPKQRKKSGSNTKPPLGAKDEENPSVTTITVQAVEMPELTEAEISDKPDGMATLTACT